MAPNQKDDKAEAKEAFRAAHPGVTYWRLAGSSFIALIAIFLVQALFGLLPDISGIDPFAQDSIPLRVLMIIAIVLAVSILVFAYFWVLLWVAQRVIRHYTDYLFSFPTLLVSYLVSWIGSFLLMTAAASLVGGFGGDTILTALLVAYPGQVLMLAALLLVNAKTNFAKGRGVEESALDSQPESGADHQNNS